MVIRVCAFTKQGRQTTEKLIEKMPSLHLKWREDEPLQEWTGEAFADHQPILFVGACGIAVRAIAPFVGVLQKGASCPALTGMMLLFFYFFIFYFFYFFIFYFFYLSLILFS